MGIGAAALVPSSGVVGVGAPVVEDEVGVLAFLSGILLAGELVLVLFLSVNSRLRSLVERCTVASNHSSTFIIRHISVSHTDS